MTLHVPGQLIQRVRPLRMGYSIGAAVLGSPGTLGAFCLVDGNLGFLTAGHVFAGIALGAPVMQPAFQDKAIAGSFENWVAENAVGALSFMSAPDADIDLGCVTLYADDALRSYGKGWTLEHPLGWLGPIADDVPVDTPVAFYGRSSGLVRATILSAGEPLLLAGGRTIPDCYRFGPPGAQAGDSGALLIRTDTRQPIGLVEAGHPELVGWAWKLSRLPESVRVLGSV